MHRIAALLLTASLTASIALTACAERQSLPAPEPRPPLPFHEDVAFADTLDLLHAIDAGTFAERAGIEDDLATATLPEPAKIEFVSGTRVPADQQGELRALAELLEADDRIVVDLVGCSDPPGSEALNLRISRNRADSVARRLLDLGVPEAQLREIVGRGEDCEVQDRAVNAIPDYRDAGLPRRESDIRTSPDR